MKGIIVISLAFIIGGTLLQRHINKLKDNTPEKLTIQRFAFVALAQTIMHYVGWISVIGALIAYIFSNHERGFDLLRFGVILFVLKYILGFWAVASAVEDGKEAKK